MNITCLSIGLTKEPEYQKFISFYENKINFYNKFKYVEYPVLKDSNKFDAKKLKEEEGKFILSKIPPKSYVIILDELGKTMSSKSFSKYLEKKNMSGHKEVFFVIGGAFGFSADLYARADEKIALSEMTFTHQMVRVIFLEQLYRGFSILKGEKYHH